MINRYSRPEMANIWSEENTGKRSRGSAESAIRR